MVNANDNFKNWAFMYLKELSKGMSLIILEDNGTTVEGVQLMLSGNKNISLQKSELISMLDNNIITRHQVMPSFVIKDMKKIYKNNCNN